MNVCIRDYLDYHHLASWIRKDAFSLRTLKLPESTPVRKWIINVGLRAILTDYEREPHYCIR